MNSGPRPNKKELREILSAAGLTWTGTPIQQTPLWIEGLNYDSRLVQEGDLFFAMKGVHTDGHQYLKDAAQKGARAALVERDVSPKEAPPAWPVLPVPSVLKVMSPIANFYFDEPSKKIPVLGITGTNGKTTVTYLIEDIFRANGKTCGVMGTINYRFGNKSVEAPNTTPMAVDVQRFLSDLVRGKADGAVMEVSSHALALGRVDDVAFSIGVFMNLTQDHLDFHKDMEAYFQAKASLFRSRPDIKSVVNVDDDYGLRLSRECRSPLRFAINQEVEIQAKNVNCDLNGIHFNLQLPSKKIYSVTTNLMGRHNVSNCLAAAGAAMAFGLSEEQVLIGLNQPHAVPGRLERVEAGQSYVVVVDYAHTPDALEKVLTALKDTGPKRLICVFGAGGDRDRTKRPKMGRVAAELATKVFITSDNPRSEDPKLIAAEIKKGITDSGRKNYAVQIDREKAIRQAIGDAREGDIVLIAGKGHETYQIIGNKKNHFSDQEVAREAISGGRS